MNKIFWILAPISLFVTWHLTTVLFDVPKYLLPTPIDVYQSIINNKQLLLSNFSITLFEALAGFIIANCFSVFLAMLLSLKRGSEHFILPIAIVLKTIPVIALTPLLVLWFGSSFAPKIATAALICFFPSLVNILGSLKTINKDYIDLFKIYNASRFSQVKYLFFPFSLPFIFSSLKISSSLAVVGALVGEFIGANKGLGFLILVNYYSLNTTLVFASVALASVMGIMLYYSIHWVESRIVKWTY